VLIYILNKVQQDKMIQIYKNTYNLSSSIQLERTHKQLTCTVNRTYEINLNKRFSNHLLK